METIDNELMMWLQQLGVAKGSLHMVQRIVVIVAILLMYIGVQMHFPVWYMVLCWIVFIGGLIKAFTGRE